MHHWDTLAADIAAHHPQVLASTDEGRAILLQLPAGERLQEHQVRERAWLVVIGGHIEVTAPTGDRIVGGAGLLVEFDPAERHEVRADTDARLLLLLTPWPAPAADR